MFEQAYRKTLHIRSIEQPLEILYLLVVFEQVCRNSLKFSTSCEQSVERSDLRIVGKQVLRHGSDVHVPECLCEIRSLDIVAEKTFRNFYPVALRDKWLQHSRMRVAFSLKNGAAGTCAIKA